MKKIIAAFAGLMMMVASATSYGVTGDGYRLLINGSVDEETPVVVTEIEFLDDSSPAVDSTEADLGRSACGWTGAPGVNGCDSVSTNRRGVASTDYPGESRSRRQIRVTFDNEFTTYFTLNAKSTEYYIQYTIHTGLSTPTRPRLNVTSYSVVVPSDSITTGAPISWTAQYFDSSRNGWFLLDEATPGDVNWGSSGKIYEDVTTETPTYYLVEPSGISSPSTYTYLWDGTDWGASLSGTALTDATTAVGTGTLIARHLKFSL